MQCSAASVACFQTYEPELLTRVVFRCRLFYEILPLSILPV